MAKKLVFVSNYLSHYARKISEAFIKIYGEDFMFIATTPFNQKRLNVGFTDMNQLPFVLRAYENPEAKTQAMKIIDEAECVIVGGVPVNIVNNRLNAGKITFMYSERFMKGPLQKDIVRYFKYIIYSGGRRAARDIHAKFYLLCTGAFAKKDYNMCGLFRDRAYKWGYFPDMKSYDDIDAIISRKAGNSILWGGRFLDWKHPELAINLAKNLRDMGLTFSMKIIGAGDMQDSLSGMIEAMNLHEYVKLTTGGGGIERRDACRDGESTNILVHFRQTRRLGSSP